MYNLIMVEDEDDEAKALSTCINRYFGECGEEYSLKRFNSAEGFLAEYRKADIVFMDIALPNLNGIAAAKKLRETDERVTLVFVTNMANLAVQGYEVSALDFLIKPVDYDSFAMKMPRILKAVNNRKGVEISIQTDRALIVMETVDIYYVEVNRHTLVYHTAKGTFSSRGTLDALTKKLSDDSFVRCNVCYLINLRHVKKVEGDNVEVGGDVLKISRARKKSFMLKLTNFLGNSN